MYTSVFTFSISFFVTWSVPWTLVFKVKQILLRDQCRRAAQTYILMAVAFLCGVCWLFAAVARW